MGDVRLVTVIVRVGLMLPPYEAWTSAREGSLSCCDVISKYGRKQKQKIGCQELYIVEYLLMLSLPDSPSKPSVQCDAD